MVTKCCAAEIEGTVCFEEPIGCFSLPASPGRRVVLEHDSPGEDYADEFILSDPELASALRAQDPPDCFLCVADSIGDDD